MTSDVPSAAIIHDGDHLVVRQEHGASDWTLITFNEISMVAASGRYWAQGFVRKAGVRALGFVTKAPNWFPTEGTLAAIGAIAPVLADTGPRVLYGHSMGAYAALKFSAALKAETVIAFSPQSTIEPAETGPFAAHAPFYTALNRGMGIAPEDMAGRIFVFYDPCLAQDRFHAGRIPMTAALHLVPVRHTGHDAIRCFASSAVAKELVDACRRGALNEVLALAARRRRSFPGRAKLIALALARRRPQLSVAILGRHATAWSIADIAEVYAHAGEGYFKKGEKVQAEHCIMAATELDPQASKHALLRSVLLFYTHRFLEALVWVRRALALAPGNPYALRHLADVEARLAAPR